MPVPTWVSALGHGVNEILGSMFGALLADRFREGPVIQKVGGGVGEIIRENVKRVDPDVRIEVLLDLVRCGKECAPLVDLLEKANKRMFVRDPHGHRIAEGDLVDLLARVQKKDRPWAYRYFADVYRSNPVRFFALINVPKDDAWMQMFAIASDIAREQGIPIARAFGGLIESAIHSTARGVRLGAEEVIRGVEQVNQGAENARAGLVPLIQRAEARLQEELRDRGRPRSSWRPRRPGEGGVRDPYDLKDFEARYFGRRY